VIENPLCARFHFTQILDGGGIADAIPIGFFVAEEVVERVGAGFGLKKKEGGHGNDGMREGSG